MAITEHKTSFAGYTLTEWNDDLLASPEKAYRVSVDFDDGEPWTEKFTRLIDSPNAQQIEALVVGSVRTLFAVPTSVTIDGVPICMIGDV